MFNKILAVNHRVHAGFDSITEPTRMVLFLAVIAVLMVIANLGGLGDFGFMGLVGVFMLVLGSSRVAYLGKWYDPHILGSGPFKGMKVEMASDVRLSIHGDLIPEFMHVILDLEEFLITDESSLYDFEPGSGDVEMREIWAKITSVYGITYDMVKSNYIVDILDAIPSYGKPH